MLLDSLQDDSHAVKKVVAVAACRKEASQIHVRMGDAVFLRTSGGTYLDADNDVAHARGTVGESCQFIICPVVGEPMWPRSTISNGSEVCLLAPNGYFLSVAGDCAVADRPYHIAGVSAEFVVHVVGAEALHHRGTVVLQSKLTSSVLSVGKVEDSQVGLVQLDTNSLKYDSSSLAPPQLQFFVLKDMSARGVHSLATPQKKRLRSHFRYGMSWFSKPVGKQSKRLRRSCFPSPPRGVLKKHGMARHVQLGRLKR